MAYYDALIAAWAPLTGSTAEKLAQINAMTVAGPRIDVPVKTVAAKVLLSGAYPRLKLFAGSAFNGDAVHDTACGVAQTLMALFAMSDPPQFQTSDPTTYAQIKGMMDALLAQETAVPDSTGFTKVIRDALLALCETRVPWWQAQGGLTGPVSSADLDAAGGLK